MMITPETINLHLPNSWNECTTLELETISNCIAQRAEMATRYNPFSMFDVKVNLFFLLSRIEIVEDVNPHTPLEEQYYICRCKQPNLNVSRGSLKRIIDFFKGNERIEFKLYVWQIQSWIEKELSWIDDEKAQGLTRFPYPNIKRGLLRKKFEGSSALMQDFSWQRYRFAEEYLFFYSKQQNYFLQMIQHVKRYSRAELKRQFEIVDKAKSTFLAIIYNAKVKQIDDETEKKRFEYSYQSNQHLDNAKYFRHFDDIRFQVILFWWQGMAHYLQEKYPHCFKKQDIKTIHKNVNSLDLYTRTTATMEKYLSMSEKDVNNQTFHIILQHLDDMAKENEEMEKIKSKK